MLIVMKEMMTSRTGTRAFVTRQPSKSDSSSARIFHHKLKHPHPNIDNGLDLFTMSFSNLLALRTLSRDVSRGAVLKAASTRAIFSRTAGARFTLLSRASAFQWQYNGISKVSVRSFSEASPTEDLIAMLRREYDDEVEQGSTSMPKELSSLQSELEGKGWKIAPQGATTKLIRTLDDSSKIQISFHVQDTVVDETTFLEEIDGEEVDEMEELAARVRFTAVLTKAGKHMVFTCISEDAQATIENVALGTSAASVDDILKAGSVDDQQYQGPEFSELAEDLQASFQDYLQDHVGIDESVASFITMYADYREQAEYVNFLSEAENMLS
jgi:complement component 1 Q subcomponent-binding protein